MINQLLNIISKITTTSNEVLPDILMLKFTIVNAFIVGNKDRWTLIDTGLESSYDFILKAAEEKFGEDSRPSAIVLTHGHFDHVGSVKKLSSFWDVPVYAHELEIPYITGNKDYPRGDSTVDEGMVAKMSPYFPHSSIDIGYRAVTLPSNGSIPSMQDWKWIHTPGHTKGHISLFRESDRTLIVGDAFTTTKQESFLSVLTQKAQIKGPPAYLTTDWEETKQSINLIKELNARVAIPSHGIPIRGNELKEHLEFLTDNYREIAIPKNGIYVNKETH